MELEHAKKIPPKGQEPWYCEHELKPAQQNYNQIDLLYDQVTMGRCVPLKP